LRRYCTLIAHLWAILLHTICQVCYATHSIDYYLHLAQEFVTLWWFGCDVLLAWLWSLVPLPVQILFLGEVLVVDLLCMTQMWYNLISLPVHYLATRAEIFILWWFGWPIIASCDGLLLSRPNVAQSCDGLWHLWRFVMDGFALWRLCCDGLPNLFALWWACDGWLRYLFGWAQHVHTIWPPYLLICRWKSTILSSTTSYIIIIMCKNRFESHFQSGK
jgi:hypothetical protein